MSPDSTSAARDRPARTASRILSVLLPPDTWLPALALAAPALLWLALAGRAYPAFEPHQTGDYAKVELYTRLAIEGSQRVGMESRFHIHHPGPVFFYAAAPFYLLLGGTTAGMALASLVWNLAWLLALLRGASRLAPRAGPFVAALLVAVFLQARGIGMLLSSWNPHVGMLPFGVALLAAARLATGEGRALPLAALATSVVVQCHIVWALPVGLAVGLGLLLCVWPAARGRLGIPSLGGGLGLRPLVAASLVSCTLWALPVLDEFTGEYRNLHRIISVEKTKGTERPWADVVAPSVRALNLQRDGQPPAASVAWGARNGGFDSRLSPGLSAAAGESGLAPSDVLWAAGTLLTLAAAGRAAARRRAATAALALIAATGFLAAPLVARYSPGRHLPLYLLQWGAMVTLVSLLVVVVEAVARSSRLRSLVLGRAGTFALAAIPLVLLGSAWQAAPALSTPRDARSVEVERLTQAVSARARADLGGGRFLVRVAPREAQAIVLGLVLAMDKAGLRFGVVPFGSCRIEGRFTPRGDEAAELLVGDLPALPGAVRLGPEDGLSLVWQR